jgi:Skp family chaperone for outer membrane proteins
MTQRSIFLTLFIFILAAIGEAQTAPTKVGIINSEAFYDEKAGITKLVTGTKTVNDGFITVRTELDTMNTRLKTLAAEIENMRKQPNPNAQVMQAKADEAAQLQRNLGYKAEDAKTAYAKKESQVLNPIRAAIGQSLQEFAKAKGYALIFDIAKDQTGLLVAVGDQSVDVTKDFITYYNAKP